MFSFYHNPRKRDFVGRTFRFAVSRLRLSLWAVKPPHAQTSSPNILCFSSELNQFPKSIKKRILDDGDRALSGYIECFGEYESGGHINTLRDYTSNHQWDTRRAPTLLSMIKEDANSDVKVPWEISRYHHLIPLAKAFRLTRDKKYVEKIIKDIDLWMEQNPFMRSVNWTSPMEAAIRAINWLWCLSICGNWNDLPGDFQKRVARTLFHDGMYIFKNLEKNSSGYSTNHYLANLAGLIYLGHCFNDSEFGREWLDFGRQEMFREIRIQFFPTGPHYELSTSYHRLTTELVLSSIIHLKKLNFDIPSDISYRLQNAVEYVASYSRQDGSVPCVGDADDGRVHIMGKYYHWPRNDHRYLLGLGHALFGNSQWAQKDPELYEEAAVLLDDITAFALAKESGDRLESKIYPDAGIAILKANESSIFIKTSNRGLYESSGGHTHNDILSFDLFLNGVPVMVDAGVGQYSGNVDERNLFRSTLMHNTVMIDNIEINSFQEGLRGLWSNGGEANAKGLNWRLNKNGDFIRISHEGYKRLRDPVIHQREFEFDKRRGVFTVRDRLICKGEHKGEWNFMLHPSIKIRRLDDHAWRLRAHSKEFIFRSELDLSLEHSVYSPSYKTTIGTLAFRRVLKFQGTKMVSHSIAAITK